MAVSAAMVGLPTFRLLIFGAFEPVPQLVNPGPHGSIKQYGGNPLVAGPN